MNEVGFFFPASQEQPSRFENLLFEFGVGHFSVGFFFGHDQQSLLRENFRPGYKSGGITGGLVPEGVDAAWKGTAR